MEENKIYVIYVGVGGVRSVDIEYFVKQITDKITPTTVKGEFIVIPTESTETRVVCINPEYITMKELVEEHNGLMTILNNDLNHHIKEMKNEKED